MEEVLVTPKPVPINKDRLTMVLSLHHEHAGDAPLSIQSTVWKALETQEQPHSRRVTIGDKWQPLDPGWLDLNDVGHICIENLEGLGRSTLPSDEEKAETARKLIEIGDGASKFTLIVSPGWVVVFLPSDLTHVFLRCREPDCSAKARITVLPK